MPPTSARHNWTNYDVLLKEEGWSKWDAREEVRAKVKEVMLAWCKPYAPPTTESTTMKAKTKPPSVKVMRRGVCIGTKVGERFYPRKVVALTQDRDTGSGCWWLSSFKHGHIGAKAFHTAREARAYAVAKGWKVERMPACDERPRMSSDN